MMKRTGCYLSVQVDAAGAGVVCQAGGALLVEALRASGLDRALSSAFTRWRKPLATHDPGKILTDLAVTFALSGDCLADAPGRTGGIRARRVRPDRQPTPGCARR